MTDSTIGGATRGSPDHAAIHYPLPPPVRRRPVRSSPRAATLGGAVGCASGDVGAAIPPLWATWLRRWWAGSAAACALVRCMSTPGPGCAPRGAVPRFPGGACCGVYGAARAAPGRRPAVCRGRSRSFPSGWGRGTSAARCGAGHPPGRRSSAPRGTFPASCSAVRCPPIPVPHGAMLRSISRRRGQAPGRRCRSRPGAVDAGSGVGFMDAGGRSDPL
jgi:hypothetical protein